jgi:hypothetical protein
MAGLTSRDSCKLCGKACWARSLTYFEWAGLYDQKIILPWRLIEGPETAAAVTNEIARSPYRRAPRTSIFGALQFAKPLFDASGFNGLRRVIDVSGDGVNNMGPPVTLMRDEVLANGITINGLPIMMKRPYGYTSDANLDTYYQDCVIGGPGSFMIAIHERDQFKEATRAKLVQEIAGRIPKQPVIPAGEITAGLLLLSSKADVIKISTTSFAIGEQLWRQRWGNGAVIHLSCLSRIGWAYSPFSVSSARWGAV